MGENRKKVNAILRRTAEKARPIGVMTGKEAVALSGRSASWLKRHTCAWCDQTLWRALLHGCGSMHELRCEPGKKDFSNAARSSTPSYVDRPFGCPPDEETGK